MDRIARNTLGGPPPGPGIPIDIEIVTNERNFPLLNPRDDIGIVARNDAGLRPLRRPSFPAPDVEHNDVAWSGLDSGFFLPGFKIGAGDRGPWLDPIDALQLRDVIENATCDDAVLPGHDAVLLASGLGRDVVGHLVAVVHLS